MVPRKFFLCLCFATMWPRFGLVGVQFRPKTVQDVVSIMNYVLLQQRSRKVNCLLIMTLFNPLYHRRRKLTLLLCYVTSAPHIHTLLVFPRGIFNTKQQRTFSSMCIFNFFSNDVKDNCLKSLSKLFQMVTALWRKRRWPDFVLLGGISRDSLFPVLWWWIDLRLRRDSHKYVGARARLHKTCT